MFETILLIVLGALLFTSAFFSSSETALFSLSSLKVKLYKHDPLWRRRVVAKLLSSPRDLLVTILMINVAVNILIQNVTSTLFGTYSSWFLNVGVPLLLTLFLGEAIPKSIAISHNAKIASITAPLLYLFRIFLTPFRLLFTKVAGVLSRVFFFFLKSPDDISIDELLHVLKSSKERGVISGDEAKLLHGCLKIDDMAIKELMQPRQEILFYSIEEPLDRLIHIFVDEECSQVPIVDKNLDNVHGIMTSGQFFLHRDKIVQAEDLIQYVKEPLFIPETTKARKLLSLLQEKQETIALAVDEYGQISGLVTKEDIVEIVIGQIEDKRDVKELYTRQGPDVIISSGKLEIKELEEILDIEIPRSGKTVTVGGWLTEQLGDIPKSGAKLVTHDLLFHVLSASSMRVQRVYIRKLRGGSV